MANLKNTTINDSAYLQLPVGTTAQRPGSPVNGDTRFNSDFKVPETYVDGAWKYMPPIVEDGMVLHLDAAEPASYSGSGTTWTDLSGNGYNAIRSGATFSNDHFSFDGTDDYFYLTSLNYGGGTTISEMSVFAWVRTTYNSGTVGVWDNNNWSLLDFDRSEVFTFAVNDTGEVQMSGASTTTGFSDANYDLVGNARINDGNWHYIGWTFSVSDQKIIMYVDGEVDAELIPSGSMTALGSGVTRYGIIGDGSEADIENGDKNNIYYEGDIGVIQFYDDKVLTLTEVKQNFNALRGRYGL